MQAQVTLPHRTWTVDEYYRMAEAGILGPDERTELIDGEIVPMTPPGPQHAATVDWLGAFLYRNVGSDVIVRLQNPLRLDDRREPQPDAMLLRSQPHRYRHEPPGPADALLVIEVSESSLSADRGVKRDRYAGFGIAEYWVLDIKRRIIVAYRRPEHGRYAEEREYRDGESVFMPGLGHDVKVEDVLGPAGD